MWARSSISINFWLGFPIGDLVEVYADQYQDRVLTKWAKILTYLAFNIWKQASIKIILLTSKELKNTTSYDKIMK